MSGGLARRQVTAIMDLGGGLFEAVFSLELHVDLAISQSRADAMDAGLRIRFRFSDCSELSELLWEYRYDREHNRFLCFAVRTMLVRYFEVSDLVGVMSVMRRCGYWSAGSAAWEVVDFD
jgi:hypothetical protein